MGLCQILAIVLCPTEQKENRIHNGAEDNKESLLGHIGQKLSYNIHTILQVDHPAGRRMPKNEIQNPMLNCTHMYVCINMRNVHK